MNRKPFTQEEQEIMNLLVDAHNKFVALDRLHQMEVQEWVQSFHRLQDIMFYRVVKRDYPEYFEK